MGVNVDVRFRKQGDATRQLVEEAIQGQRKLVEEQKRAYRTLEQEERRRVSEHKSSSLKIRADIATIADAHKKSLKAIVEEQKRAYRTLEQEERRRVSEHKSSSLKIRADIATIADAHKKSLKAIESAQKQHYDTQKQLSAKSTKQLINDYAALQERKKMLNATYENSYDAHVKKVLAHDRKMIQQQLREYQTAAMKRGEVLTQGAGARVGILGTGRQLISQSGLPGAAMLAKGALATGGLLAFGAGMKEAISLSSEFEDTMANLQAITGLSKAQTDQLGLSLRGLSKDMGIDASESAVAMKLAISALGPAIAQDQSLLTQLSKDILTLTKISGVDAPTATNLLTTTINQFGLKAKDSTMLMNLFAAAAKEGAAEIPDLGAAVVEVGATAKMMGLDVADASAAIEVLSMNGIKGAQAGTMYRNVLQYMASGTEEAQKALKLMGLTFRDINPKINGQEKALATLKSALDKVQDPIKRASIMTDLFRKENQNAAQILIENNKQLGEMKTKIEGTTEAERQLGIIQGTRSEKLKRAVATVKDFALALGDNLLPALSGFLEGLNLILGPLGKFLGMMQQASSLSGVSVSPLGGVNVSGGLAKVGQTFKAIVAQRVSKEGATSREDIEKIAKDQASRQHLTKYTGLINDAINEAIYSSVVKSLSEEQAGQKRKVESSIQAEYDKLLKEKYKPGETIAGTQILKETLRQRRIAELLKLGATPGIEDPDKEKNKLAKQEKEKYDYQRDRLNEWLAESQADYKAAGIKRDEVDLLLRKKYYEDLLEQAKTFHQKNEQLAIESTLRSINKELAVYDRIDPRESKMPIVDLQARSLRSKGSLEIPKEKGVFEGGIRGFIDNELKGQAEGIEEDKKRFEELNDLLSPLNDGFSALFGNITSGFDAIAEKLLQSKNAFENFAGAFLKGLSRMAAELAAKAFLFLLFSAVTGGTGGVFTFAKNALGFSSGGEAPKYYAAGNDDDLVSKSLRLGAEVNIIRRKIFDLLGFKAKGTDTVPAMLTPGEGILNTGAMKLVGADGLRALNKEGMKYMAAGGVATSLSEALYIAPKIDNKKAGDSSLSEALYIAPKIDGKRASDTSLSEALYIAPKFYDDYSRRQNSLAQIAATPNLGYSGGMTARSAGFTDAQVSRIVQAIQSQPNKVLYPAFDARQWDKMSVRDMEVALP